ncbi:DUF4830 domain-containing protein [Paenibacillus glycinis]|uniref:DUF4830 domain-containing protein n=1 Tax=Paenibacillus glycinis TaxID=2697035 RepID=A0ABW9XX04_9BACL|nr:DUF4830 domain-containing protein [Paenibacillus glycinis]NBD27230.1 DUF4830 domain-containing protein [Paenibacillus glycinis]
MKKDYVMLLLFALCFAILTGCKSNEPEDKQSFPLAHKQFIEQYGWTIRQFHADTNFGAGTLKASYQERANDLKTKANLDLSPYVDKEVIETEYILNESINNYNEITCHLFESEGKIIAAYLVLNQSVLEEDNYTYKTIPGPTRPMMNKEDVI